MRHSDDGRSGLPPQTPANDRTSPQTGASITTALQMAEPRPAIAGVPNTFAMAGATPLTPVHWAVSLFADGASIPGCLAGFDLASPLIFMTTNADQNGDTSFTMPVPAILARCPLLLQTYDPTGCATSNVMSVTF